MKKLFYILVFLPCVSIGQVATYKPNPDSDPAWELVPYLSDEFNGAEIDEIKWDWQPPWGGYHGQPASTQACLTTNLDNRRVEDGSLILSATNDPSTCTSWNGTEYSMPYTVGALYSDTTIKYGYFEIRMRIPDNTGSPAITDGFGPSFWTWPLDPYPKDEIGDVAWSEIDFYEFRAGQNLQTFNMHFKEIVGPTLEDLSDWNLRGAVALEEGSPDDAFVNFSSGTWHTFSGYWGPQRVSFYRDGIHLRTTTEYCSRLIPMNLVVDINTPAVNFGQSSIPGTSVFPYEYEIDYIRVYKLGMACDEVINDCSFWFGGYDNKV